MEQIIALTRQKYGDEKADLLQAAYDFMKRAHTGQKRADGTNFYEHPVNVAHILYAQGHEDAILLSAALLHDVVEDTPCTLEEIENKFGEEVAFLVDAASDVGTCGREPRIADKYERMQKSQEKVISYGQKDPRVFLIKAADRIHNLQTMSVLSKERQKRLMNEARDFHKRIALEAGEEEFVAIIDRLVEDHLDT